MALESWVPAEHQIRQIGQAIDLSFLRARVAHQQRPPREGCGDAVQVAAARVPARAGSGHGCRPHHREQQADSQLISALGVDAYAGFNVADQSTVGARRLKARWL